MSQAGTSRHFLYRLVRKFIRSVASSEKNVATTVTIYRLCVDGDMEIRTDRMTTIWNHVNIGQTKTAVKSTHQLCSRAFKRAIAWATHDV